MRRISLLVSIIGLVSLTNYTKNLVEQPEVNEVNLNNVEDGYYIGSCETGLVKAKVSVKVENGAITNIDILEHDTGLGKKAEGIAIDIVERQSLEVDCISGATLSSNVIKKAIENALMTGTD